MIFKGSRRITQPIVNGQAARMLVRGGRQVWPCRGVDPLPQLEFRLVEETDGRWFEVGFRSPEALLGTAATGWTDPRGYCRLDLLTSPDLATWAAGRFTDCAATAIANGDGTWDYWSRSLTPHIWMAVMVDLTARNDRYGKSITEISVLGTSLSLPHFPYAMPAAASQLAADLSAAGFPGAQVTATSAAMTARIKNHTVDGALSLVVTQAAGAVTSVAYRNSAISLPSYPYALPSQRAALQTDLRAAGHTGAVVMLHADWWEITLPDIAASGSARDFSLTLTPGDPFKYWNGFGVYQGENPATGGVGTSGNVRDPSGAPLQEAATQFARMRITRGARPLP